jgi:asparagine synthase (glutamine-hydrolysing)
LRYADRNSMAHGVEVRLPFLQQELVQFIFSLPATYKMNNGFSKLLLRKTLEGQLPDSIVWRKDKVGFEPPQAQWMQRQDMQELLMHSKQQLLAKGIINQRYSKAAPTPQSAYAPENIDWYCLCAGLWMEI